MPTKSWLRLPTFKLHFAVFPPQPSYLAKILPNLKTYITRPYRTSLLLIEVVIYYQEAQTAQNTELWGSGRKASIQLNSDLPPARLPGVIGARKT